VAQTRPCTLSVYDRPSRLAAEAPPLRNLRPGTLDLRRSIFRDALAIIEAEYASELHLEDVAHRVASSRRQLQRAFAEVGDTTFVDQIARVRAREGAELLTTSGLPVRIVARRVGYRQPAHFAKVFRAYHGVAPATFRRQMRGRGAPGTGPRGGPEEER
jgi:transcriptional regulator GlxA family with amidase domain